jgi:hypothetical protein
MSRPRPTRRARCELRRSRSGSAVTTQRPDPNTAAGSAVRPAMCRRQVGPDPAMVSDASPIEARTHSASSQPAARIVPTASSARQSRALAAACAGRVTAILRRPSQTAATMATPASSQPRPGVVSGTTTAPVVAAASAAAAARVGEPSSVMGYLQ